MSGKKRRPRSVVKLAARRTPGLDGTYTGTCIACLRATDTAMGIRGEPEWHAAFLVRLGLPMKEAIATTERYLAEMSEAYPLGPDGEPTAIYRVCSSCMERAHLPKPVLALVGAEIPMLSPKEGAA